MADVETWEWSLALAFVVCSAFCSGSETALTALGDVRARQLAESGSRRSRLLALWLSHPERVLSTLLVGNTLVNIGAGALGAEVAATYARTSGVSTATALAVATAVTTAAILLFGEVLPKTFAKRFPVRLSLAVIPLVYLLYWALWPISAGLVHVTSAILKVFGGGKRPAAPSVTSEEIEYLIDLGTREGVLDEVREELLNSVLEFADLVVKEVMVPRTRIVAIEKDAAPEEILRIVTDNPHSRTPVYEGSIDNVVGVLLVRDLIGDFMQSGAKGTALGRVITARMKPPYFVPEQMKISRLLREMQRRKTHLAVVVDEFGGTSGLVTMEDVIEEIVGEIQDEADAEAAPVKAVSEGVYLADASVSLRELEEYLNVHPEDGEAAEPPPDVRFPEEGDYETLGGFVTAMVGRVPPAGSVVAWNGLTFTVRAGDERRVTKVEIARTPEAGGAVAPKPGRTPEGSLPH